MLVALVLLFFVLGGFCVIAVSTISWRRWHKRDERAQALMDETISDAKAERQKRLANAPLPKPPTTH